MHNYTVILLQTKAPFKEWSNIQIVFIARAQGWQLHGSYCLSYTSATKYNQQDYK